MTKTHANARWPAFERLDTRRHELCEDVMAYDRRPGELWRALKNCPAPLAARYSRLCRISALYRVAAILGAD